MILNQEKNDEEERNWCLPGFQFAADGSDDRNPSLRLLQHFCCYSTSAKMTSGDDSGSPETSTSDRTDSHVPTIEPIRVTTAEYHEDLEMLAHSIPGGFS